ncbi:MAG: hypothetical protein DCC58_00535 [Chloroflexi bacterium]|nr:MAG: hypothetical protein DCC58_00535 [Chloroflexota bacterium]
MHTTLIRPADLTPHLADPRWVVVDCRFDLANPGDLWLHARNMPGAHVILRWNGPDDAGVLTRAASLAAWYSDGRGSTTVPVDVTERRFVRKIRGGGPGLVTYRNERTLDVHPRAETELNLTGV